MRKKTTNQTFKPSEKEAKNVPKRTKMDMAIIKMLQKEIFISPKRHFNLKSDSV